MQTREREDLLPRHVLFRVSHPPSAGIPVLFSLGTNRDQMDGTRRLQAWWEG